MSAEYDKIPGCVNNASGNSNYGRALTIDEEVSVITQKDEVKTDTISIDSIENDSENISYSEQIENTSSAAAASEVQSKSSIMDGSVLAYDPLSYDSLLVNYRAFRQAGTSHSSSFNTWDFPSHNFFRLLFHFTDTVVDNSSKISIGMGAGLLHPSWINMKLPTNAEMGEGVLDLAYWDISSAWTYLMQNAEYVRANFLKQFIELLSNINTESPWYFQSIKGLDAVLQRKQVTENFEFAARDKITIECLDDSQDNRIGTLLDLYRAAMWSWQTKRVIVPANLRKFDMSIVIISSPVHNLHTPVGGKVPNPMGDVIGATSPTVSNLGSDYASASASSGVDIHRASYKLIELHNCEIDYNASSSGYTAIENANGFGHKYDIDIYFDDAIEIRYNEFLEGFAEISDLIGTDIIEPIYTENTSNDSKVSNINRNDAEISISQENDEFTTQVIDPASEMTLPSDVNTTEGRIKLSNPSKKSGHSIIDKISNKIKDPLSTIKNRTDTKGLLKSVVDELEEYGASLVSSKINRVLVGNLFGLSVSKVERQLGQALNGQIFTTIQNINDAKRSTYNGKGTIVPPYSNIFEDTPPDATDVIGLGNIFRGRTIAQS